MGSQIFSILLRAFIGCLAVLVVEARVPTELNESVLEGLLLESKSFEGSKKFDFESLGLNDFSSIDKPSRTRRFFKSFAASSCPKDSTGKYQAIAYTPSSIPESYDPSSLTKVRTSFACLDSQGRIAGFCFQSSSNTSVFQTRACRRVERDPKGRVTRVDSYSLDRSSSSDEPKLDRITRLSPRPGSELSCQEANCLSSYYIYDLDSERTCQVTEVKTPSGLGERPEIGPADRLRQANKLQSLVLSERALASGDLGSLRADVQKKLKVERENADARKKRRLPDSTSLSRFVDTGLSDLSCSQGERNREYLTATTYSERERRRRRIDARNPVSTERTNLCVNANNFVTRFRFATEDRGTNIEKVIDRDEGSTWRSVSTFLIKDGKKQLVFREIKNGDGTITKESIAPDGKVLDRVTKTNCAQALAAAKGNVGNSKGVQRAGLRTRKANR